MSYSGDSRTQTNRDSKSVLLSKSMNIFCKRTGTQSPKVSTLSGKEDMPLS